MSPEPQDLDRLLGDLGGSEVLDGFAALISPLERYDREHNSDLAKTLRVYFESNANASEAAQRLYLHRNSLNYRLLRVQSITGLDLGDPKAKLALQLGLLRATERDRANEPQHPQQVAGNGDRNSQG
ncbi:PucR family transcriptional regulator [Rubrobacter indicoceani]|uniref:PucR family transcriptional regulator n=1 Tax=Rubrobacter indicoceani TaxID=2051957 RepID=UPI000E5B27F8|nr:helix-turn-helix domain-containing protein [Rubrobacter indicoceani]